jgi:polyisoprenoid-binding protein YceI
MKIVLIIATCASLLFLQGKELKVKSSSISFKIKNAGMTTNGSFSGLESKIIFDPLKPDKSSITASVNSASVNTGNNTRDGHLRKTEYFDVSNHPKISLSSVKIEKTGPISFTGTFKLSIKGVTKEVKIPFLYMKTADKTEMKGSFSINRLDYNVGESSFTLSDDVTISLNIVVGE